MELISREEALKVFGDIHPLDHNTNAYKLRIEKLPIIESRPKGKWIEYWFQENVIAGVKCSNCNSVPMMNLKKKWNFCPNCGADMRKEK